MMNVRIKINPVFKRIEKFVRSIPAEFERSGETIYEGRNTLKRFSVDGRSIIVKRFKVPHIINRMAYSTVRASKAERSFTNASRLLESGIDTPAPVAFIECRERGLLGWSYYACLEVPSEYKTVYHLASMPPEKSFPLYEAIGRYCAFLHSKGVHHKDFSPGNILMDTTEGEPRFTLVDINRLEIRHLSEKQRCANFARLWASTEAFRHMAMAYADAAGMDPDRCTALALKARARFWSRYGKRHPIEFNMD